MLHNLILIGPISLHSHVCVCFEGKGGRGVELCTLVFRYDDITLNISYSINYIMKNHIYA